MVKINYENEVATSLLVESSYHKNGFIEYKIGDYVRRNFQDGRDKCSGFISKILKGNHSDSPGLEITDDDGKTHLDYYYCFTKDVQKGRDIKLEKLGI